MTGQDSTHEADVIVVGAGPGGSSTAIHLAKAGLDVLLLEKTTFPREKVCGDGLTPRAIKELVSLGVRPSTLDWKRNKGLRIHVGRAHYQMGWPELSDFPSFGMTVRRSVFDEFLAHRAMDAGARLLTGTNVQAPILHRGRITGVTTKDGQQFTAPLAVAADGNSARLAVAMGRHRMENRPLGLAIRTYFTSPTANDKYIDSWLELWDDSPTPKLLPGYAWSFPLGDGTCNVGLGLPDANRFKHVDLRDSMTRWLAGLDLHYEFTEAHQVGPIQGAALPMGFNRKPLYGQGLLLVGDAAGAINPFNGEGISYAMESGRFAAEQIIQAHGRGVNTNGAERALIGYARRMRDEWGGYFQLGNTFSRIISNPKIMKIAAHYGLPIPVVRTLTHRMLSHLTDRPGHDFYDHVVGALTRLAPKA
ncbi:MAG: geranylgeranyl reductase family protein [Propionibacteriaceae bacterium]|nr:geranylgeranyl reductase family protein [Propionibacteriaceae bacterium]